jgi:hypothetical protein
MPLCDHFRPPFADRRSWEGFHAMWPAAIVMTLLPRLPRGYFAEPRVHLGSEVEIDLGTFDDVAGGPGPSAPPGSDDGGSGAATAVWAPPRPTPAVEAGWPDQDEYEVRVFDERRGRRPVAAVEIVSPSNKDRPEHRRAFIAQCAALLQERVCVAIVDLVTTRGFNLYGELLDWLGQADPAPASGPCPIYAVSARWSRRGDARLLETWAHPLTVGQPLPTLPLWLAADLAVPLDLGASDEETRRLLRIS